MSGAVAAIVLEKNHQDRAKNDVGISLGSREKFVRITGVKPDQNEELCVVLYDTEIHETAWRKQQTLIKLDDYIAQEFADATVSNMVYNNYERAVDVAYTGKRAHLDHTEFDNVYVKDFGISRITVSLTCAWILFVLGTLLIVFG